ncbi:hypothetical protein ES705_27329 [subsurface metagenome]
MCSLPKTPIFSTGKFCVNTINTMPRKCYNFIHVLLLHRACSIGHGPRLVGLCVYPRFSAKVPPPVPVARSRFHLRNLVARMWLPAASASATPCVRSASATPCLFSGPYGVGVPYGLTGGTHLYWFASPSITPRRQPPAFFRFPPTLSFLGPLN